MTALDQERNCHVLMPSRLAGAHPARILGSPLRRSALLNGVSNQGRVPATVSRSHDGTTTTLTRRGKCNVICPVRVRDVITLLRAIGRRFVPGYLRILVMR